MKILDIIDELDRAQEALVGKRFVAPVVAGAKVRLRLDGVVCELSVDGRPSPGLAVLEARSKERARVVGEPTRRQRRDYFTLFPLVRLILVEAAGMRWLACRGQAGSQAIEVSGLVPLHLVEGAGRFDSILARFDGARFLFEARDRRRERSFADYLREAFEHDREAKDLDKSGLNKLEREAYLLAQYCEIERRERAAEEARQAAYASGEGRLRLALEHAGAELTGFIEHPDRYQVSWAVDGQRHTTAVTKGEDLGVMVAGICLSGQDARFDLASLVGVVREGRDVLRIGGGGMNIDEYFAIHPREN